MSIGGRLAAAEGIQQLFENWEDSNFAEIIGGPSFQLTQDIGLVLWDAIPAMVRGEFTMTTADATKMIRNVSSANRAYRTWLILKTGDYVSRNGSVVVGGLSETDAILNAIGFSSQEANFAFERMRVMKDQDEHLKEHGKRIREMVREMDRMIENNDLESARALGGDIAAMVGVLSPWEQEKIKEAWWPQVGTMVERAQRLMITRGQGIVRRGNEENSEEVR
jgi:hypothetical protein